MEPMQPGLEHARMALRKMDEEARSMGGEPGRCEREVWSRFSPDSVQGKQIYESFSDEELLKLLRERYEQTGRIPKRSETCYVHWQYIKRRFGSWTQALQKAGLVEDEPADTAAVREKLKNASEDVWLDLFQIEAAKELPEHTPSQVRARQLHKKLIPYFGTKNAVLLAGTLLQEAGCRADALEEDDRTLQETARTLRRTPLRAELPLPAAFRLWKAHGGDWDAVLRAAKLAPLKDMALAVAQQEYALRAASPDLLPNAFQNKMTPGLHQVLERLCRQARALHRAPAHGEIPKEDFDQINRTFGSWRHVLDAMGICPLEPALNRRLSRKRNKKRKKGHHENQ